VTTAARPAVTARVPAKLNLQLAVGPPRDDGYHDLITIFHAVSLFDEVTVRPAARTEVVVTGESASSVPRGHANLAARAASALARATRGRRSGSSAVRIEISKRIPVAAGLAGGSADAAAALAACNELWHTGLSQQQLCEIGARVGSDVPFALVGGTAIGQGRGERLTAALAVGTYHWVLAFSASGLSTPQVYATCDRLRAALAVGDRASGDRASGDRASGDRAVSAGGPAQASLADLIPAPRLSTELMAALRSGDPAAVGPLLANDLQPAAISLLPDLRRALAAGREYGALGAIVSGSGPTCAFLTADAEKARELAVWLTGAGVCRAVARVSGPVPGATVLAGERG
jgi:4-diphosphocytidyl-2-C-methyl-D-erythritol kinase